MTCTLISRRCILLTGFVLLLTLLIGSTTSFANDLASENNNLESGNYMILVENDGYNIEYGNGPTEPAVFVVNNDIWAGSNDTSYSNYSRMSDQWKQKYTLAVGTDYSLSFKNNDSVGTASVEATGAGDYSGTLTATFKIIKRKLDVQPEVVNKSVVFNTGIDNLKVKKIKIRNQKNYTLSADDYTVSNGVITIKRKFLESYQGTTIALELYIDAGNYEISNFIKSYNITKALWGHNPNPVTYKGKKITPKITVSGADASDFKVTYKKSKRVAIGKYYFTITGKGDCIGKISGSFVIRPKRPASIKSVNRSSKKVTVKWGKVYNCTGYQVQLIRNAEEDGDGDTRTKYTVYKSSYVKGNNKLTKTFKSAYKKKYSKIRVRAYKKQGTKTYYSVWTYRPLKSYE